MRHKQRFFPANGYTPKFYGYARVSHKTQHDKGDSISSQEERLRVYFQMKQLGGELPGVEWGGMFSEPLAQSAYTKSFPSRPAGKELVERLQPSDHVGVDKLDRIFRDLEDFTSRRRWFAERAITVHFINLLGAAVDTESIAGQMMLANLAMWAEIESMNISDRISRARAARRAAGRHQGTAPPFFCDVVDCKPGKVWGGRLIFKPGYEQMMEKIAHLKDDLGHTWDKITVTTFGEWSSVNARRCENLYRFWKAWSGSGRPDVNTLKIGEFVRDYWKNKRAGTQP